MAECDNQVGVRNILIKFLDCDSNTIYGPLAHTLAGDAQPTYRLCDTSNEPLPGGFVRRTRGNNMITINVIRDLRVPLALYQGCASIDITVEHYNGMVVTGISGTATGDTDSDGHEVEISATFKTIDEFLPAGTLV